ncbi:NAD(P)/FAD-dependent oxidoreductase [Streptomyces sp. NPDC002143]
MHRAVVIGAGLAGVLAAAAVAGSFEEVVVLERDDLPDGPVQRKGVPQGRHAHLLMPGGLAAMEEVLVDVDVRRRLLDAGAHEMSLTSGMLVLTPEGWLRRWRHDRHRMLTCSRTLLDWVVRAAVKENYDNVKFEKAHVEGLTGGPGGVDGVSLRGATGQTHLDAAFVIDASGRGTRITNWLAALGVTGIEERNVDAGLVNATRVFRMPVEARDFPLTLVQANPYIGRPARSGMMIPIEDDQWMVSLAGSRGGEPPADPAGFLRYALDLPHPIVGELISAAEPLTDVVVSQGTSTSNARRYFENSQHWPERLVAIGDSVSTFNPAYGQGMSVAAINARTLYTSMRRHGSAATGLARRIQRDTAKQIEAAWTMAVSQDVLYPDVRGGAPTLADRLAANYTRRLTKAATGSYRAASALIDVTSLTAGPTRVLRPTAVLDALMGPLLPVLSQPPLTHSEQEMLLGLTAGSGRG